MSKHGTFAIILATAVTLAATPAFAAVKTATLTGVIRVGIDKNGIFGAANASLNGKAYTSSYVYDTSVCCRTFDPGVSDRLDGYNLANDAPDYDGPSLSPYNILSHVSVTVNGITYQVGTNIAQFILMNNVTDDASRVSNALYAQGQSMVLPAGATSSEDIIQADFLSPFRESLVSNTVGTATSFLPANFSFYNNLQKTSYNKNTTFSGSVDTFSITGNVPEPANWAMMIAGFGLIGATQRRRRLKTHSVAA